MQEPLKVKFVDFPADDMRNITLPILKKVFGNVQECDDPDFLFYSVFGHEHLKYDCVRIFWTGENLQPDFNICDYAIGFGHIQFEDRYKRIPLYYFYDIDYQRAINKHLITQDEIAEKNKFCNFVYSNANAGRERQDFFHALSEYKKVDSGGKFLNNMDGQLVADKYEFQKKYKFTIAFENSSTSGYTTEKILQAFAAGTIPIYWGNPRVAEDFNSKAFINCHEYATFEEVVQQVRKIDADDEMFEQYIREPIGNQEKFPINPLQEYESYLIYICSQSRQEAYRRNNVFWGKRYQDELRDRFVQSGSLKSKVASLFKKV